jgi:hypothetical protein
VKHHWIAPLFALAIVPALAGCGSKPTSAADSGRANTPNTPTNPPVVDAAEIKKSLDNLTAIGKGALAYLAANESKYPSEEENERLSWRVKILPYLGDDAAGLYKRFKLDEPWDGPNNKQLVGLMPDVFVDPRFQPGKQAQAQGLTYYRGFVGPNSVFGQKGGLTRGLLTNANGASNTLLVVEAGEPMPWTKPESPLFDAKGPFGGPKREDFYGLWGDGFVSAISKNDDKVLSLSTNWMNTEPFTAPGGTQIPVPASSPPPKRSPRCTQRGRRPSRARWESNAADVTHSACGYRSPHLVVFAPHISRGTRGGAGHCRAS